RVLLRLRHPHLLWRSAHRRGFVPDTAVANIILSGDQANIFDWNQTMQEVLMAGDNIDVNMLFQHLARNKIRYLDQIPPFDVTITGKNELGLDTSLRILGVQIMTEASGISVDDITLEKAVSFIAR